MSKEKEVNLNWQIFKGMMIIIILLIIALLATNGGWFLYEMQFKTIKETTITSTQDVEDVDTVNDIILDAN